MSALLWVWVVLWVAEMRRKRRQRRDRERNLLLEMRLWSQSNRPGLRAGAQARRGLERHHMASCGQLRPLALGQSSDRLPVYFDPGNRSANQLRLLIRDVGCDPAGNREPADFRRRDARRGCLRRASGRSQSCRRGEICHPGQQNLSRDMCAGLQRNGNARMGAEPAFSIREKGNGMLARRQGGPAACRQDGIRASIHVNGFPPGCSPDAAFGPRG